MKLTFSLIIIFLLQCPTLYSREIILIENKASLEEGLLLKKILIEKFHLPKELIRLKKIKLNCEKRSNAILHLCLEKEGDLKVIKMNKYVIENSLGVFMNDSEEEKNESF
ncbi:MAG: hypothetical protein KBD76_04340 [Bacteriovorax sp.]|nr:hypothetical protein [Bacteriovorax sp.]